MACLLLIRHGKSEWNDKGLWTGWTDIDLNEEGIEEARRAGGSVGEIEIHSAHVSALKRAQQTLQCIKDTLKKNFPTKSHAALNERNYGVYTGKNKWQVKEKIGEEAFQKIRRGWDVPIPNGESLKDVHARVVPYFTEYVLPEIIEGKNVLVVAHGNSLRALAKHLEKISDEAICELEIGTGEVHCYTFEGDSVKSKEIRAMNKNKGKV